MYGCEILFDAPTAEAVKAEVRRQLGGECPCDIGQTCPLLPSPVIPVEQVRMRPAG